MAENDTCGKTIQPTADQIKAALRLCAVAEPAGDYPCKQCYLYPLSRDGYMSTGETCFEHLVLDTCQLIDGLNDFDKTQSKILLARCQSLQAQLTESQRRERAAVEDLEWLMLRGDSADCCIFCRYDHTHDGPCAGQSTKCEPKWRGPQDGKGEAE